MSEDRSGPNPRSPRFIFASVTFSRLIYALCWFNMAAAFPAMASALHYSFQDLGLLTASFLLGTGIFQIPAGVFSAHRGATKAALLGLAIIGMGSAASAFVTSLELQLVIRFATGVGAAFYFAPAVVIVSEALGAESSGFAIGIYNGSFNMGGVLASLAFTPIAAAYDWRLPFIITGVLTVVAIAENVFAFRGLTEQRRTEYSRIRSALTSRQVWVVILATIGIASSFYVVTQLGVSYSEDVLHFSPFLAGSLSSLALIGAALGSALWGRISDRLKNRRVVILATAVGASASFALLSLQNPVVPWFAAFFAGFFTLGALTASYAYPVLLSEIGSKYAPLSIGLMNATAILGGALVTAGFAIFAVSIGYPEAWLSLAVVAVVLAPFIYLGREPGR